MRLPEVLDEIAQALASLEAESGRLRVRSIREEHPLNPHTLDLCRAHKAELLAYLEFAEQADTLLLESTRRLAKAWPDECQLEDDPRWDHTERELRDAYWSLDVDELEKAIGVRERVARGAFAAFRKERAR